MKTQKKKLLNKINKSIMNYKFNVFFLIVVITVNNKKIIY